MKIIMISLIIMIISLLKIMIISYVNGDLLAYFDTTSNVTDIASMDIDMSIIIQYLEKSPMDTTNANIIYARGRNFNTPTQAPTISDGTTGTGTKSPTSVSQTPKSFKDMAYGSDTVTRLMKVSLYKTYSEYWKSQTFADDFVTNAFNAKGDFANAADVMRSECAQKGIQFQIVWMYISYKMTEAIEACKVNIQDSLTAWDQAWALYTGSLEGPYALDNGLFSHSLGEIDCIDFGTCNTKYTKIQRSSVNNKILSYFEAGRALIRVGDCDTAAVYIGIFQKKSVIPFIQGTIRGAYRGDPKSGYVAQSTERNRALGESWAYAAALLPMINMYNQQAASIIRENMNIASPTRLQSGYKTVVSSLQSVYKSLGISCGEIGALKDDKGAVLVAACDDNDVIKIINDNGGPAVAVLVVFFIILVSVSIFCCFNMGYTRGFKAGQEDGPPPANYFQNYKFPTFRRNDNPTMNEDDGISPQDQPTSVVIGSTPNDAGISMSTITQPQRNSGLSSNGMTQVIQTSSTPNQQPPPPRPQRQSTPPQQKQQQQMDEEIATI